MFCCSFISEDMLARFKGRAPNFLDGSLFQSHQISNCVMDLLLVTLQELWSSNFDWASLRFAMRNCLFVGRA